MAGRGRRIVGSRNSQILLQLSDLLLQSSDLVILVLQFQFSYCEPFAKLSILLMDEVRVLGQQGMHGSHGVGSFCRLSMIIMMVELFGLLGSMAVLNHDYNESA